MVRKANKCSSRVLSKEGDSHLVELAVLQFADRFPELGKSADLKVLNEVLQHIERR